MKIKAKQYAQALFLETQGRSGEDLKEVVNKFFKVLKSDNSLSQIEKIIFYFEELWNQENSYLEANLISSRPIDNNSKSDILGYLKKASQLDNIRLTETEDDSLVGGFVLKYGNKMIDASVKNKINALKNSLLN